VIGQRHTPRNNEGQQDDENDEEIKMSPYFPRGSQVVEEHKSPKKLIKSHKNHIVMGPGGASRALKNYNSR